MARFGMSAYGTKRTFASVSMRSAFDPNQTFHGLLPVLQLIANVRFVPGAGIDECV